MNFADKVRQVRMKLYMSQSQFAKELGVSFATVNRWENQNIVPQIASLGKFNDFCQTNRIQFED